MRMLTVLTAAIVSISACAAAPDAGMTEQAAIQLKPSEQHAVDTTFMHYDFNADGRITKYEQRQYLKASFGKVDQDSDGLVSVDLYDEKLGPRHPGATQLRLFDTNADGHVDIEEYIAGKMVSGDLNGDGSITRPEYEARLVSQR